MSVKKHRNLNTSPTELLKARPYKASDSIQLLESAGGLIPNFYHVAGLTQPDSRTHVTNAEVQTLNTPPHTHTHQTSVCNVVISVERAKSGQRLPYMHILWMNELMKTLLMVALPRLIY
jgi:hypothetical protein